MPTTCSRRRTEVFTLMVKDIVSSYKDPAAEHLSDSRQVRDEARPRARLLRGREF